MEDLDFGTTLKGFSAGQKIFKRYVLTRLLGRGGMGVVWLATDEELGRETALKFLPEVVAMDPAAIGDLKREVRRAIELAHPHIVKIHDFVTDGRTAAVSMEYVTGQTLSSQRLDEPGLVFKTEKLGPWLAQLCSALDYAHHDAEVVHRDLKPTNLMIDGRGRMKVLDFGIAASISDTVSRVSNKGSTSGTPVYMSPQQMMGEDPAITDDVYALGATVFELLSGKPPFHAGNIVLQVQNKVAPLINERCKAAGHAPVPVEWEQAIAACLAKEPKDRPQSAGEFAERLGLSVAGTWKNTSPRAPAAPPVIVAPPVAAAPIPAPVTPVATAPVPGKMAYYVWKPALWAFAISFVVVGLGGLVIGLHPSNDSISFPEKLGLTAGVGLVAWFFLWILLMFVRAVFTKGPKSGTAVAQPGVPWLRAAFAAAFILTSGLACVVWPIVRGSQSGTNADVVNVVGIGVFLLAWSLATLLYAILQGVLLAFKTRNVWAYVLSLAVLGGAFAFLFLTATSELPGRLSLDGADLAAGVLAGMTAWGAAGWISHRILVKDRPPPGKYRRWWQAGAAVALLNAVYFFFVSWPNDVQMAVYQQKQVQLRADQEARQKEDARLAAETAGRKQVAETAVQEAYRMVFDRAPDQETSATYVLNLLANPAWDAARVRQEMRASPEGKKGGRLMVPAEFPTIQEALNAAVPGNAVHVAAGTYHEALYLTKAVDLIGAGRDQVEVEFECTSSPLFVNKVEGATISGFTFRHTDTDEKDRRFSVVRLKDSTVRLQNNSMVASNGDGVFADGTGTVTLADNIMRGSRWSGISLSGLTRAELERNVIEDSLLVGFCTDANVGTVVVTGNTVRRNKGSGMWVSGGRDITLTDNQATENEGNGIGIGTKGRVVLKGNVARDNKNTGIWWTTDVRPVIGSGNYSDGKELTAK